MADRLCSSCWWTTTPVEAKARAVVGEGPRGTSRLGSLETRRTLGVLMFGTPGKTAIESGLESRRERLKIESTVELQWDTTKCFNCTNMDMKTSEQRSENMRRIRRRDTRCELSVRRAIFVRGGRYRVDDGAVFGRPDLSFRRAHVAVFVDSDFWHGRLPDARIQAMTPYWRDKMLRNRERDERVDRSLVGDGWVVVRIDEKYALREADRIAEAVLKLRARPGEPRVIRTPSLTERPT